MTSLNSHYRSKVLKDMAHNVVGSSRGAEFRLKYEIFTFRKQVQTIDQKVDICQT